MYAFGLEETGEYERAERAALRALEIDEGDVWAVHAMAHVLEMQGRQKEGEAFLESSASHWRDSFFAVHNWWHLALYYIELDKLDGALDLYDGPIREHCSGEWLDLVDAASLLWRLSLLGVDTGDRAQEVVSVLEGRIGEAMYPFNDLHSVMAFCLAQKPALADKLITERKAVARGSAAFTLERAGLDLLKGIAQFARGDYRSAENYLLKARPNATVMGGSNAQRDIVDQTLLVACARGGDINANLALSSERRERQHWSDSSIERLGGILA
jgi:tetratricopeptide (TPR) repeat protein